MAGEAKDGPVDPGRAAERAHDERLVRAVRDGDAEAFGRLYDHWFDRVHDLARRITGDDGLAADVAQDAFLAAWQRLDGLDDPASFGGWLLRITRNRALDVVRAPGRARTEAVAEVSETTSGAAAERLATGTDPAELAGDREVRELVWGAAEALGERDLTALDLHLRHGLEPAEIGEVLGINRNAANQLVHRMRGRLSTAVACRVLWQGGRPRCERLRRELAAEGVTAFDARTVRVTDRHAAACDACTRRRTLRLDPAKLFAALPIPVAGLAVKQQAAAALAGAGVPMGGSTATATAASAGATTADAGGGSAGHDGDGGVGGGPEGDPTPTASSGRTRRSRRRAAAVGALAVLAVVAVLAVGVEALGDGGLRGTELVTEFSEAPAPTTTSTTSGEGTMVLTPVPGDAPADGGGAADAADPVPDPGSGGRDPARGTRGPLRGHGAAPARGAGGLAHGQSAAPGHRPPQRPTGAVVVDQRGHRRHGQRPGPLVRLGLREPVGLPGHRGVERLPGAGRDLHVPPHGHGPRREGRALRVGDRGVRSR